MSHSLDYSIMSDNNTVNKKKQSKQSKGKNILTCPPRGTFDQNPSDVILREKIIKE